MNKTWKKNLLKAITFCLIFIISYIYGTIVFIPKTLGDPGGSKYYRGIGYRAENKNSIDLMGVGNSDLYFGFSPVKLYEDFGYVSYCGGVSKQSIYGVYSQFKDSLMYQKPKVLILEIDCVYSKKKIQNSGLIKEHPEIIYFVNNHSRWKTVKWHDFFTLPKKAIPDNLKGYVFSDNDSNFQCPDYMGSISAKPLPISPKARKTLDKILDLCQKNEIAVFFLTIPSATSWSYAKHYGVAEYAKEHNIDYIDMNLNPREYGLVWEDDYMDNGNHCNYLGAHKVTKFIGEYLQKNYDLPDRRNNAKYNDWEKCLKDYQKLVQKAKI